MNNKNINVFTSTVAVNVHYIIHIYSLELDEHNISLVVEVCIFLGISDISFIFFVFLPSISLYYIETRVISFSMASPFLLLIWSLNFHLKRGREIHVKNLITLFPSIKWNCDTDSKVLLSYKYFFDFKYPYTLLL